MRGRYVAQCNCMLSMCIHQVFVGLSKINENKNNLIKERVMLADGFREFSPS
jgi:hypothetical protein